MTYWDNILNRSYSTNRNLECKVRPLNNLQLPANSLTISQ